MSRQHHLDSYDDGGVERPALMSFLLWIDAEQTDAGGLSFASSDGHDGVGVVLFLILFGPSWRWN